MRTLLAATVTLLNDSSAEVVFADDSPGRNDKITEKNDAIDESLPFKYRNFTDRLEIIIEETGSVSSGSSSSLYDLTELSIASSTSTNISASSNIHDFT
ncbi:hypothetical protein JG687_00011957 [Phytophthora cactorum]|uniref:Uncharacterized protein n=1 Tax=Phytophthora cactorum TaxID=29920 RepID=A0A329SB51_9STRA|nr:hypothetical protein Pcac1_g4312 [Phytophthora cactorum]KAG2821363.1 hypothetical protein PC112_g11406 [Phytophthora cactorum]KAG2829966.1 hypothetical protein PC111_g7564 [Phytophthora cactorum]KAG2859308.1 hypothetical protein PC113_g9053 [Phytophthora cactorum]KAG2902932.1 hypothetical protein PC114_g12488 [Phytophthora cactorum]